MHQSLFSRCLIVGLVSILTQAMLSDAAFAQAGLRDTLEAMDKNNDGQIQPEEITPLARPYLERIAKSRKLSLHRPNRIDKLQEAARIYHAIQNGVSGERTRAKTTASVKSFRPDDDQKIVPEFGIGEVKFEYTQDDVDEAYETLGRYDRNRDGFINRAEAARGRWTHRNPFEMDLNEDGLLSRMELVQRYARRRLLDNASDELVQKAIRTGNGIKPSEPEREERRRSSSYSRSSNTYLASTIMSRFDSDRNGRLDEKETAALGIPKGRIDFDRDGVLSRSELSSYFEDLQEQAGNTSEIVPGWFYELDKNRDEQIVMTEFTDEWTDEKVAEFVSYDGNGDGILTATEILNSKALTGGTYNNADAQVLPPRKTIISEIDVPDDFVIGDLNLRLSITHTYTSYLDAYLTGPDGTRIELFTGVGSNDDHFDKTVFDDQSSYPIIKARPPFRGTYQPEALTRRQPSLSAFNDKSIKGVWQLVIRATRSDRFGMLHSWSLMVTPKSDLLEGQAPAPAQDGPQAVAAAQPGQPKREEPRRQYEGSREQFIAKARERIQQAEGWQRGIKERLARTDISDQERAGLNKKMEQIERYKEHLQRGGERDDFKRKEGKKFDNTHRKIQGKLNK